MESIIFIAPPAAGKGTLSKMFQDKYKIPHISTGDLLREASRGNDEDSKKLHEKLKSGFLVDDEIIMKLLEERISQDDCKGAYIMDGFPRTINQAKAYEKLLNNLGKNIGQVFYIGVDIDVARDRIIGRLSCPKCNAVYNELIEGEQPKVKGACNTCQVNLIKRSDDNVETFEIRFKTYMENTEPLINYYDNLGILHYIPEDMDKKTAFKLIEDIVTGGAV